MSLKLTQTIIDANFPSDAGLVLDKLPPNYIHFWGSFVAFLNNLPIHGLEEQSSVMEKFSEALFGINVPGYEPLRQHRQLLSEFLISARSWNPSLKRQSSPLDH
jgi:hypothetical protein